MSEYSVHLEARAPREAEPLANPEALVEGLADALAEHEGVGGATERSWEATVTVEATDAREAADVAASLVADLAEAASLPAWPLTRVEAVRGDVLDQEQASSNAPPLVSGPEAAELMGVARQRVHQLAATHPDFPAPLYELAAGKLWDRRAVKRFAQQWARRPGRPAKDSSASPAGR